jgi:transposase
MQLQVNRIPAYSRYSARIRQIISSFAIETSANKTRHICKQLHIPVSSSSVLRMVHSLKIDTKSPVTVLGIDDWAIRKGTKNFKRIKSDLERELLRQLLRKSSLVRKLRKVYIRFKEILKKASVNRLQEWLHQVINLDIKQMSRLANGIKQDIDAVSNAISSSWSSGRVEGKINKLKTLKRQMYGRASLDLLRRKMIFSITG